MITKFAKTVQEVIDTAYEPVTTAGELSVIGSGLALKNPVKHVLSKTLDPYVTRSLNENIITPPEEQLPHVEDTKKNLRTPDEAKATERAATKMKHQWWLENKLRPAMGMNDKDVFIRPGIITEGDKKATVSSSFFEPRFSVDQELAASRKDFAKDFVGPPNAKGLEDVLKAKRGGVAYVGTPDIAAIAHELGHAKSPIANNEFVQRIISNARDHGALHAGLGALATYKRVRDQAKDPNKSNALTYAANAVALAPTLGLLAEEGGASIRGIRGLSKVNTPADKLLASKKKLGKAYLTYLVPALAYHGISNAAAYGLGKYHNYRDAKKNGGNPAPAAPQMQRAAY